jgi:LmbE family N-acetylglucosaminyl deacetylase
MRARQIESQITSVVDQPSQTNRRLLAVLAHPDDESFGPGGTLALYATRGVEVHLVCATQGEVGTVNPENLDGYADIGELRRAELACAVQALGVKDLHFLGYRDSGMPGSDDNHHPNALAAAPFDEVVAKITDSIRQVRPQVVITFDPVGGYHHPDHIMVHRATLEAFHAASDPLRYPGLGVPYQPEKLYYFTFSRTIVRLAVRLLPLLGRDPKRFGLNEDIDLTELASDEFPIHTRIDIHSVRDIKARASACHASQQSPTGGMNRLVGTITALFDRHETYMRAYPPATAATKEKDLFAGVPAA